MVQFTSLAEQRASKCSSLNGFKDFNLISFKALIKDLLDLFGKNSSGIFLTYTKHDISHINAMLDIAEWLIPEKTKNKMTAVDWLLLVLSIYLHDLGMVTTDEEFTNRNDNFEFQEFKRKVLQGPGAEDYNNRIASNSTSSQETFYFQEFVRYTHARRIKDWILASNHKWDQSITKLSESINAYLSKLPPRFTTSLALVCESHHLNDLDDDAKYPLYETYGTSKEESANIQYAAIILRTLDLIHITRDRTPSTTFKLLNITDPIGILEWEKQLGTYAVLPISRVTKEDDPETHIIAVSADFTEERPFFTLSEYLSYADVQIKQSKSWIEKSTQLPDGEGYQFPWHSIKGNIKVEGNDPIPLKFELDRGKLLDLLVGHTIYNDPTVVVRELLQNSIDAIRYRQYLEKNQSYVPKIQINWISHSRDLIIVDNGIGMNKLVITNHLMRVGSSFYSTPEFQTKNIDFFPISKFGIGILTCFMVSDSIEILTKRGEKGYRIKMTSVHSNYLLKELNLHHQDLEPIRLDGTIIKLKLRPSVDLSKRGIADILKYWIIFPPCTISYKEDDKEPQTIGFSNTETAFENFYITDVIKDGNYKNRNIISDERQIGKESYSISFCSYNSFSDIPNFLPKRGDGPVICLEGIRVSDSFPQFGRYASFSSRTRLYYDDDSSIAAIVSIRNTKLRTTVARDGLEFDDEYIRLGEICLDFIFKFVTAEVKRISELPEHPYSRASIAAEWLLSTIYRTFIGESAKAKIEISQSLIPSIVIEQFERDRVVRKMVSENAFLENSNFWSVESRLLDYLKTLSKDLGKELGFNTFIEKLAPDLLDKEISPLLIESTSYDKKVYSYYKPALARYSEKHQQLSVKWEKRIELDTTFSKMMELTTPHQLEQNINAFFQERIIHEQYARSEGLFFNATSNIFKCEVRGDRDDIKAIINAEKIYLQFDSDIASAWQTLRDAYERSVSSKNQEDIYIVVSALCLFYRSCANKIRRNPYSEDGNWNLLWGTVYNRLTTVLEKNNLHNNLLRKSLNSFTGEESQWFSAFKYWFDWSKRRP